MEKVTIENLTDLPYAVEEAINCLRVNISFLRSDVRKIIVGSSMPNEGKSFVTMQLWRQMALAGCPLLGIVLNRVNDPKRSYYHKRQWL